MPRRKSYRDIQAQSRRIRQAAGWSSARARRVSDIEQRYLSNIRNANAYRRDQARLQDAINDAIAEENEALGRWVQTYRGSTPAGGPDPDEYEFRVDEDAFPKLSERPYKRHYTRAVYQQGNRDDVMSARAQSKFGAPRTTSVSAMANVGG